MSHMPHLLARLLAAALIVTAGIISPPASAQIRRGETPNPVNAATGSRPQLPVDPFVLTPVAWSVLSTPVYPVRGTDGRLHLAYEMLFTNVSTAPARLQSIEVVDPARNNQVVGTNRVVTIKDEDVTTQLRQLALPQPTLAGPDFSASLPPARSAYLYLDVTFDDLRDIPRQIKHRVTVSQTDAQGTEVLITGVGGLTRVVRTEPVVLSPPLKGDRWVDGSGCCEIVSPHRYTILPVNGTLRPPENFAIDFIQLDAEGRAVVGDIKNLNNWHFYGAEVIAAAAGKVVQVVNDLPDQVPGELPAGITAGDAAGNHVIIDMGRGKYALYAHLIPGSAAVGVGDIVQTGQLLGRLGNSGNTDAPHLHFQVMDRPSALDADGLPFVFDRMEFQGRIVGTLDEMNDMVFAGTALPIDATGSGRRRREMPLSLDVLGFR